MGLREQNHTSETHQQLDDEWHSFLRSKVNLSFLAKKGNLIWYSVWFRWSFLYSKINIVFRFTFCYHKLCWEKNLGIHGFEHVCHKGQEIIDFCVGGFCARMENVRIASNHRSLDFHGLLGSSPTWLSSVVSSPAVSLSAKSLKNTKPATEENSWLPHRWPYRFFIQTNCEVKEHHGSQTERSFAASRRLLISVYISLPSITSDHQIPLKTYWMACARTVIYSR